MSRSLFQLYGKNIVVYDLEIKKTIDQCSYGWASHDEMGISVGCAFDYRDMRYRVFMDDNIAQLVARLNEVGTLVVAFNHIDFDNKLLRATKGIGEWLKPDDQLLNYDMLRVSRLSAGAGLARTPGFRLDDHLSTLGLPMKSGDGAQAPVWWQEGRLGKLIDYCLNDVTQERALFEHMWSKGSVACVAKPEAYPVPVPTELFA